MDFIERWFDIAPDGGDGMLEAIYAIVAIALVACVVFRRRIVSFAIDLIAALFSPRVCVVGFMSRLRTASPDEARTVKAAAFEAAGIAPPAEALAKGAAGVKPGSERWAVKTGADADSGAVNAVVVDSTVREMGSFPRPPALRPDTDPHTNVPRTGPVETTVWRVSADVIALKMEADGDYHLVLQDDSGALMVAEVPLPKPDFVSPESPFADAIAAARKAVDAQFAPQAQGTAFLPAPDGKLVPRHALQRSSVDMTAAATPPVTVDLGALTQAPQEAELFAMRIDPTPATITGVGFFDSAHGATGAAPNTVELHPVLDITFGI